MLGFFYTAVVTLLGFLAVPLTLCCYPTYRARLRERFGFGVPRSSRKSIWIHAASVGEVRAVAPLVNLLLEDANSRNLRLVVTTISPASAALVARIFPEQGVSHYYLPLDIPFCLTRFIRAISPVQLLTVETEIWPNLLSSCIKHAIPFAIINARLSPKRHTLYMRAKKLISPLLRKACVVIAQSDADGQRFIALGLPPQTLQHTGNLKYDLPLPARKPEFASLTSMFDGARVLLAASTHEGEDEQLINCYCVLNRKFSDLALIIAPRNLNRVPAIKQLLKSHETGFVCRTNISSSSDASVLILDTLGELVDFYASADLVFVGGSLVNRGGHNPIEPAMAAKAIVSGRNVENFADVYALLGDNQAVAFVDAQTLQDTIANLLADDGLRGAAASRAYDTVQQFRGATVKTREILRERCTFLQ